MGLLRPKAKGDKYEREVAKYLDELLYDEEFQKILRAKEDGASRENSEGFVFRIYLKRNFQTEHLTLE